MRARALARARACVFRLTVILSCIVPTKKKKTRTRKGSGKTSFLMYAPMFSLHCPHSCVLNVILFCLREKYKCKTIDVLLIYRCSIVIIIMFGASWSVRVQYYLYHYGLFAHI